MKELLKRLLCLVMALTMVGCLVACGSSVEEEDDDTGRRSRKETTEETEEEVSPLVGEWTAEIDISEYMNDMMEEALEMDLGLEGFVMVMNITFNEDGTYEAEIDISEMEDAMEEFVDILWETMVEMVMEEAGCSRAVAEQALESEGYGKEDLAEEMGLDTMFDDFEGEQEGKWILEDDELYMAEKKPEKADPVTIEFDGDDEFSITDGSFLEELDDEILDYVMPIVFERQ